MALAKAKARLNPKQLHIAGFRLRDFKDAGFEVVDLKAPSGPFSIEVLNRFFTPAEMYEGCTAAELKKELRWKAGQMRRAGYTAEQLQEADFKVRRL